MHIVAVPPRPARAAAHAAVGARGALRHAPGARHRATARWPRSATILTEPEAKRVLAAYGIPVVPTEVVLDAAEAAAAATRIGFPVAVKILSREITHKSDVGGVALDLDSEQAVLDAVRDHDRQGLHRAPGARIDGFVVQPMIKRPHAVELILGAAEDPVFGPILHGRPWRRRGRGDRRQGAGLAAARSGAGRGCAQPHARRPPAARLSRPAAGRARRGLRGDGAAVAAHRRRRRDRRARHQSAAGRRRRRDRARCAHRRAQAGGGQERAARFAIRPYPVELETEIAHRGEKLRIRPIRPDDEPLLQALHRAA